METFLTSLSGRAAIVSRVMPVGDQQLPALTEASLAVLPLRNTSGDLRDDAFCEGVTADIIINLSRFRDLLVIARRSAFVFKDQSSTPEQVGKRLGVRYLFTGELKRSDREMQISAKLADTSSSGVLWSNLYEGKPSDIFTFQDDISDVISAHLAVQIRNAERHRLSTNPPEILAYFLNLQAEELSRRYNQEAKHQARRLLEKATEIDPHYGRSYAGLSRTFNLDYCYSWTDDPQAALERAVELAKIASDRDSFDARGFSELGYAYLYSKRHEESLAAYRRAFELNPNDADILSDMADALVHSGAAEQAVELLQRAMLLNPLFPDDYLWHLGDAYFSLGDYRQTIATAYRMQDLSEAHRMLAASYAHLGELGRARHHADQVMKTHPNFSVEHWSRVPPYRAGAPALKMLVDGLRKAGLK